MEPSSRTASNQLSNERMLQLPGREYRQEVAWQNRPSSFCPVLSAQPIHLEPL